MLQTLCQTAAPAVSEAFPAKNRCSAASHSETQTSMIAEGVCIKLQQMKSIPFVRAGMDKSKKSSPSHILTSTISGPQIAVEVPKSHCSHHPAISLKWAFGV